MEASGLVAQGLTIACIVASVITPMPLRLLFIFFAIMCAIYFVLVRWGSYGWISSESPSIRKCSVCLGRGAMWLTDGKLVPIPDRYLQYGSPSGMFNPPLANVQKCDYCQGLGKVRYYDNAPVGNSGFPEIPTGGENGEDELPNWLR